MEGYLSVTEAAAALGLTRQAILLRLERGVMRGTRAHPRLWLIPTEEVERWKALGRQRSGRKPKRGTTDSTPEAPQ